MASKTHLLIFLSIAIMATSIADAQILNPLLTLRVTGIVNCTLNSTVGGPAPPFPNATVQLRCPPGNSIIASATTNSSGGFTINVNPLQFPLIGLLTNCRVVVITPLVNCNASLPANGTLVSGPLILSGIIRDGLIRTILLFVSRAFTFTAGIGVN